MKLTIGMAVADDYDGVYFTVQALRMYHPEVELIIVDNMPDSKSSPALVSLMGWVKGRYIAMDEKHGTTQPRNRIFEEATGEAVMCIDSHVLLKPNSVARLINFYHDNPGCKDLLTGPMLYDDLTSINTHFDNFWRAEMWGIWGIAWGCRCGVDRFTVLQDKQGNCDFRQLGFDLTPVHSSTCGAPSCSSCGRGLPSGPFAGHQQRMKEAGFISLGEDDDNQPFPIPGQGLGLFTCMRHAWLGFNPHMRGFGGEEMYIHEKYRKAGHQAMCLPFLKWGHRFGRPRGIPYAKILTRWNKIRNYVLGAQEIGLPLEPIREHFLDGGMIPQWEWKSLIKDPIGQEKGPYGPPPTHALLPPKKSCGGAAQPRATIADLGELMAWVKENPRDIDRHADKIAEYAAKCDVVVELTKRRETTIPLLNAKEAVHTYIAEMDNLTTRLVDIFPAKLNVNYVDIDGPLPQIPECDLLFLSYIHTAAHFMQAMDRYASIVRKYIILHNTTYYGEQNKEGGQVKPGLLPGMRIFMRADSAWSVVYHSSEQFGLTVLSKVPEEKPTLPGTITMATNLAKAAASFVADGMKTASKEMFNQRLEICSICPQRTDDRCSVCGCFLQSKARPRVSECPIGKWPQASDADIAALVAEHEAAQTTAPPQL